MIFHKKQKTQKNPGTTRDYEKLGKDLVSLYETLSPNRKRVYQMAFLKGLAGGVGGVVGATVVVALLLWVLSLFNSVPLVGGFFESLQQTIEQQ